jgi:hypothetical protein
MRRAGYRFSGARLSVCDAIQERQCHRTMTRGTERATPQRVKARKPRLRPSCFKRAMPKLACSGSARRFGKAQAVYDPWHFVPVLARKPNALQNGVPFKDWSLPSRQNRVGQGKESEDLCAVACRRLRLSCNDVTPPPRLWLLFQRPLDASPVCGSLLLLVHEALVGNHRPVIFADGIDRAPKRGVIAPSLYGLSPDNLRITISRREDAAGNRETRPRTSIDLILIGTAAPTGQVNEATGRAVDGNALPASAPPPPRSSPTSSQE